MNKEDPTQVYNTTFQHIYNTNGFAISAAMNADGKEYKPISTHACLDYGYLCFKHFKEEPFKILYPLFFYPISHMKRYIMTILTF